MINKKVSSHEVTGCLNETPKGGLHVEDFNSLLRMDDLMEGTNGWFHIVAPQTLTVPSEYGALDLLSDQFLFNGHPYVPDAFKSSILFINGSRYTVDIVDGHKLFKYSLSIWIFYHRISQGLYCRIQIRMLHQRILIDVRVQANAFMI